MQQSKQPFVIFQRKGSKNLSVRFSLKGKQVRKSLETENYEEAQQKAFELWAEANYRAKNGLSVQAVPFSEVAEKFIKQINAEIERDERSPYHARDWPPVIRRYLIGYFGDKAVDTIQEADLENYIEWRRQYWVTGPGKDIKTIHYERNGRKLRRAPRHEVPSISRQRGELVIVRGLFEQVAKWGHIRHLEVPKIRERRRRDNRRPSFEPHEYEKLIETSLSRIADPGTHGGEVQTIKAKDGREWEVKKLDAHRRRNRMALHCYIEIAALTGMRPTELKNLNWGDVLDYREIRKKPIGDRDITIIARGKGKSGKLIPHISVVNWFDLLWMMFEQELGREPRDDDPVFADQHGNRIQTFKKGFNELLKACDLEFDHRGVRRTSYSLRHFYVSQQLAHGVPIHDLARNTRTSIAMIDKHYGQVTVDRMKDSLRPDWDGK